MTGEERREKILEMLVKTESPIAARTLAAKFGVSRQIIVSDIALLRASNHEIASTNRGYLLIEQGEISRVFKVYHTDEQVEDELNLIVDFGGSIKDVFVYHKIYGTVRADLNLFSRRDVRVFMDELSCGKSSLLKNVTSGYHYHTVTASSEKDLDMIQEELQKAGFLAELQDYEPVNFWKKEE